MKMVTIGLIICIIGGTIMIIGAIIYEAKKDAAKNQKIETLIDETQVHKGGQMVHVHLERQTSALFFDKEYWRRRCNAGEMYIQALEVRARSQDPEFIEMMKKMNWKMRTVTDKEIESCNRHLEEVKKELDDSFKNNQP